MYDYFRKFFDTSDFPRRWECGIWSSFDGWLHIGSDFAIWGAYTTIPFVLVYFIRRRRDVPFMGIFVLFAAFILCCGTGHLIEALIFWVPVYRISGAMKFITAVVSWATVFAIIPLLPKALLLRSPEQLEHLVVERTQQLRESEARGRSIIEAALDAVVTFDLKGRITGWNCHAESLFGYTHGEAIGQSVSELIVPDRLRDTFDKRLEQVSDTRERDSTFNNRHETRAQHKDGHEFAVEWTLTAVRIRDGNFYSAFIRDITERRRAEQSLRYAKAVTETINRDLLAISRVQHMLFECRTERDVAELLTSVSVQEFNATYAAIWMRNAPVDPAEEQFAHPNAYELVASMTRVPANGEDSGLFPPNQLDPIKDLLWQITESRTRLVYDLSSGESPSGPITNWMRTTLFHSVLAFPIIRDGQVVGVFAAFHSSQPAGHVADVYELLGQLGSSSLQNVEHIAAVERADRAKAEFLANMSHEIRSPMTAIMGFAERIVSPSLTDSDRVSAARTILRNGDHLMTILNDVLDLSKIEAGKLETEQVDFSLLQLVADLSSLMSVRAENKGIDFKIELDSPLPVRLQSDPTRIRQILLNLIGNAIKFTHEGEVRLCVRTVNSEENQSAIDFMVVDTGIGMSPDEVQRVFSPFSQADASLTRRFGGTGLGLAISWRLADLLGGFIDVETEIGKGSRFRFRLPRVLPREVEWVENPSFEQVPDSSPADVTQYNFRDKRILIVEDRPENRELLELILRDTHAIVLTAHNGQEAVDYWQAVRAGQKPIPDVILMDMQMPVLDGYSATRSLRQLGCRVPIIAVTAQAMQHDRDRSKEAGCDGFVSKPYDYTQFMETLDSMLSTPDSNGGSQSEGPEDDVPISEPENDPCPIDYLELSRRTGGKADFIESILASFAKRIPDYVTQLESALEAKNWDDLSRTAHAIRGTSGNLAAQHIYPIAIAVEERLKSGELKVEPHVERLIGELRRFDDYLNTDFKQELSDFLSRQ